MYYQQPPFNPQQPQRERPRRGLWGWYRRQRPFAKIALGCFSLALVLFLCVVSLVAVAASNTGNQTQTQPTPTATTATLAKSITQIPPTVKPTAKPTLRPTPKPTVKPVPTHPPVPTPTPKPACQGVNGNPWCYDFTPGNLIYTPPSGFCNYFNCIPSFYGSDDPGDGYINECQDGTYSQSGGERGDCSSHGGEMRPLYSH